MKIRNIFYLFLSLFLLGAITVNAVEVPKSLLRKAAENYYVAQLAFQNPGRTVNSSIVAEFPVSRESVPVYDIFNFAQGGWVLISADYRVLPVLAYSLTGTLEPNQGSPELTWWLDRYATQILDAVQQNITPASGITAQWSALISGSYQAAAKDTRSVQPLLNSTWDQGNYYNYYCPLDAAGPGGRVWAGCVATSMSQVMYYYRYPLQGNGTHGYYSDYGYLEADFGSTTYDWNAMQDNINHQYNLPMAMLQYHCGLAVDMGYSPDGSGAYMGDATQALIQYFGYSASANLQYKNSYSDAIWKNMLTAELDARHPLSYAGYGDGGGHAFVCDGYDATGKFHFNWGWSGYGDGYFFLDNMNPNGSFSDGQQAIFDLIPGSGFPYGCSGTTTINANQGSIDDGSGAVADYSPGGDCMWLIDPVDSVQNIRLSFTRFSTEAANDVVTVYDGPTTSDSVLGTFSGSTLPAQISSTGDKMLVRFTTNSSVQSTGWMASFESVLSRYCQSLAEFTAPSGSFSDGSGASDYNNNTACRWRISPPGATGITINFSSFDLEGNDFLVIYDEISGSELGNFRGNTLPPVVFVYSSKALLTFLSGALGTAGGFDATYTSSTSGITEGDDVSAMLVYPNPSGNAMHFSAPAASGPVNLHLYSATGAEMLHVTGFPVNGVYQHDLDVTDFATGLYLLVFENEGNKQIQRISVVR